MQATDHLFPLLLVAALLLPALPLQAGSLQTGVQNYYTGGNYRHKLAKSRARLDYTANGTALYCAPDIGRFHNGLGGEELGNVVLGRHSRVRRVYIYPVVHGPVDSTDARLKIGTLRVNRPGTVDDVDINVTIEGDVRGNDIEIGSMEINGGQAGDVQLRTTIQGDVESR